MSARPAPEEHLVANARGLAAAALLPIEVLARLTGRSTEEIAGLRDQAINDWVRLQRAVQTAKGVRQ